MRDRQYLVSLAGFAGAAAVVFTGIVALMVWLGWAGLVGLLTVAGGILAWFYRGPRSDLQPRG
ncbi:MAG: hypothetical protein WCI75_11830 [candidate division NC10 bacterium]